MKRMNITLIENGINFGFETIPKKKAIWKERRQMQPHDMELEKELAEKFFSSLTSLKVTKL